MNLKPLLVSNIINMSLNPKPTLEDYFSNNWLDKQPFFKMVFSKIRFFMIYWNLQISFQPDSMRGATSKSFKVKAFLKKLENKFKNIMFQISSSQLMSVQLVLKVEWHSVFITKISQ